MPVRTTLVNFKSALLCEKLSPRIGQVRPERHHVLVDGRLRTKKVGPHVREFVRHAHQLRVLRIKIRLQRHHTLAKGFDFAKRASGHLTNVRHERTFDHFMLAFIIHGISIFLR